MKTTEVCFAGVNTGSAGNTGHIRPVDLAPMAGANTGSAGDSGVTRPVHS